MALPALVQQSDSLGIWRSALNAVITQVSTDETTLATAQTDYNTKIGILSNLTTTFKTNLVGSINEVNTNVGSLAALTTTAKSSAVSAINEAIVKIGSLSTLSTTAKGSIAASANELYSNIGVLTTLTTSTKTSTVSAINEIVSHVGTLASLTTTAQNNLVAAINEVRAGAPYNGHTIISGNITLDATYAGRICYITAPCVVTLPQVSTFALGQGIYFSNISGSTITFAVQGSDVLGNYNAGIPNAYDLAFVVTPGGWRGTFYTSQNSASTISPAFTGTPTAPSAGGGTNTSQLATTFFAMNLVGANFTNCTANTGGTGTSSTQIATTAFAMNMVGAGFTNCVANTQAVDTNNGYLATCLYVYNQIQKSGTNSQGSKTISSGAPSGGVYGDIWYQL
jgi:hypothetical protein